jgi:rSAM/selenodomain-associated transferase 1
LIALLLFGKRPAPGRVKTRLARALGAENAAALAAAFLSDAARRYRAVPGTVPILAAEEPGDPFWAATFTPPWRIEGQGEGDLGERLRRAFDRELAAHPKVAAIGSDHPALPAADLSKFLAEDNAVWPTLDGGYAAIVLSRAARPSRLFERIDWSTDRVLAQTLQRAIGSGLALTRWTPTADVDEPADVDRLARELSARDTTAPDFPRDTWNALRLLGRTP